MVVHEVEAMVIASQTKITRKQSASSSIEPAHNRKISMHSPSSNAIISEGGNNWANFGWGSIVLFLTMFVTLQFISVCHTAATVKYWTKYNRYWDSNSKPTSKTVYCSDK